ncbi:MAG: DUF262 domain-containing protein [Flavobacterium sp.]|nr:MAG: DUF262 domain-containing protein [Flavobacterium sp.]
MASLSLDIESAEKQITEKQKIVDFDIKEFTIELLISKYTNGRDTDENDIYIPPYQREFVWHPDRQSKFIESVLIGLPIPYIFTADIDGRLEMVDGTQRLRTLERFYTGKLKLQNLDILTELNGFKYEDLTKARQRKFQNTTIRMITISDKADEDVRYLMFERINTGSDILKDMEKRKGIFGGKFIDFVYNDCATHPLFRTLTVFTENMNKRGEPQELIIRFFAYAEKYTLVSGGVNEFLNKYTEEKNKSFNKEVMLNEFVQMLTFVNKYFPLGFKKTKTSKKTPRVRFDSISVGTILALREKPNVKPKSFAWLNSKDYEEITKAGGQNAPTAIAKRIEYVRDKILGR